jgi:hypothetical protein
MHKHIAIWSSLCICVFSGCGDGRPARVPIAGQVLIDGKPLTQGQIKFVSSEGRPSIGRIGENGRFQLSCYEENDGALVGKHQVAVISTHAISEMQTRWYTPKKYADHRTSGLTQEITGPNDNLVINISWDGGREFVETIQGSANEGIGGARRKQAKSTE